MWLWNTLPQEHNVIHSTIVYKKVKGQDYLSHDTLSGSDQVY